MRDTANRLVGVVGYHVGLIRDRAWREAVISGGRQFDPGTGHFLIFKYFLWHQPAQMQGTK